MSTSKVSKIGNSFIETIIRFPLTFLIAVAGTIVWLYIIYNNTYNDDEVFKLLISLALGLPLSFAMYLMKEHQVISFDRVLGELAVLLLIITYYITIFNSPFDTEVLMVRYLVLTVAVHLLVAFSAYIKSSNQTSFWKFNQVLFVNIITSGFFTLTLYAGIALALFAIDELFGVRVRHKHYFSVYVVLVGIFNTLYFLSRTPQPDEDISNKYPYPKGLRIFATYILVPLTVLYACILYLYILKIIINWELPDGGVAWLITIFSVAGLLTFLLIYPYRDDEENKWLKTYTRTFFWSMFPLVIMLFVSIFTRLSEYGFTENRYLILALAIWLLFISIYCLITKSNKIKAIPISLFIFCIISVIGPLSAFNISNISQKARFIEVLERNNMLEDNRIKAATDTVSGEDHSKMVGIIRYFFNKGQSDEILEFYPEEVAAKLKEDGHTGRYISYYETDILVNEYMIGHKENMPAGSEEGESTGYYDYISYNLTYDGSVDIDGYQMVKEINLFSYNTTQFKDIGIVSENHSGSNIEFKVGNQTYQFYNRSDEHAPLRDTLRTRLAAPNFNSDISVPIILSKSHVRHNSKTLTLTLVIKSLSFVHFPTNGKINMNRGKAWLLIKEE